MNLHRCSHEGNLTMIAGSFVRMDLLFTGEPGSGAATRTCCFWGAIGRRRAPRRCVRGAMVLLQRCRWRLIPLGLVAA